MLYHSNRQERKITWRRNGTYPYKAEHPNMQGSSMWRWWEKFPQSWDSNHSQIHVSYCVSGGWSVGVWFLFWQNKCFQSSGNLALKTWVWSHYDESGLLSYWSSYQSFKPKHWIHAVICLARNISLISRYHMSIDYVQNCLHACSVPTPRVPCRTSS